MKKEKEKNNAPAISLAFSLLGLGLLVLAEALVDRQEPEQQQPKIVTEDLGYAEEVK